MSWKMWAASGLTLLVLREIPGISALDYGCRGAALQLIRHQVTPRRSLDLFVGGHPLAKASVTELWWWRRVFPRFQKTGVYPLLVPWADRPMGPFDFFNLWFDAPAEIRSFLNQFFEGTHPQVRNMATRDESGRVVVSPQVDVIAHGLLGKNPHQDPIDFVAKALSLYRLFYLRQAGRAHPALTLVVGNQTFIPVVVEYPHSYEPVRHFAHQVGHVLELTFTPAEYKQWQSLYAKYRGNKGLSAHVLHGTTHATVNAHEFLAELFSFLAISQINFHRFVIQGELAKQGMEDLGQFLRNIFLTVPPDLESL